MAYEVRFCSNCATELQWIVASEDSGEVQRLRCPSCGFTHWGNPTPVLAAVVEGDDGRVLLARNALWQEGVFGLITGFMEAGESPEAGICREVLEETGLREGTASAVLLGVSAHESGADCLPCARAGPARGCEALARAAGIPLADGPGVAVLACGHGLRFGRVDQAKGFEPRFGAFRPGQNPEPDPAKWPVRRWAEDTRFTVAPALD
jgi:DNA-directed RNA polymerase subunit RPC12/RpoP